jgi:penicillin-binding protein 1C
MVMMVRAFLRYVFLFALLTSAFLSLSACGRSPQLGARPAADVMGAVEAYLQRYQPGPLPRLFQTTRVYDRHGTLLAELWDEGRRTWVSLDRISPHLINATIATEDATFYVNTGFDPARIAGAVLQNVQQGQIVSGASTITMQLARNLFLGPDQRYDQSMDRKMLEVGLAQELTTLFTKDELLEMYLNLLNYGHLAYGPEAAAQTYFGKSASQLTLAEATLLAGIPQRPADLDPFRNLPAAKARQRIVLDLMVRHGYLSPAEADAVYAEPITLNPDPDRRPNLAPHFMQYVEDTLDARLGDGVARRAGLQITTTLDLSIQNLAQKIVAEKVAEAAPKYDLTNGALVAMRLAPNPLEGQATSGEILAMVGSADFYNDAIAGQVNVAVRPRQPGSAIKPVLYATALNDNLISPATVLWDVPVTYTVSAGQVYTPTNYDGRFHGPVTARTALANSYNIPAVRLLHAVTVERMLESAQAMGIRSLARGRDWYGLSLTLGGGEVTLLELTTAFAVLANGGVTVQPRAILSVTDSRGRPVDVYEAAPARQVVSQAAAFLVTDILSDNTARTPMFGANSPLKLSRPAAAKTGTTTDWRDNWTVGYTRYLVTGVWAGNSDGRPMKRTSGLTGAAPIWHDFMEGVLADPAMLATLEASPDPADWQFQPPPDVEQRPDCPPGLSCREGGEFFSRAWLEAAGEAGPLADSVSLVPTAPVYVDSGEGGRWTAYCQVEPAVLRPLLKLPGTFGLPQPAPEGQESTELAPPDPEARLEQLRGVLWSLRNPTAVNLGPCDALGQLVTEALNLSPDEESRNLQVLVDLAAAMDPNAGPVPGQTAIPVTQIAPGGYRYVLAQPVTHHRSCPGNYIVGQVLNRDMAPVPGVHIVLVDQWGNRMDAISKSGASDFGHYDFPIHYFANRYTLTVVDEAGNPISPPVVVDHLQGDSGDAPCHTVIWRGG